ncbi:unnamed protein product [Rotaria sp. Silwood2]|nr:unnamed protein product [Rotaria sp. Silwood2]CAF4629203.1 unnamed protein product [Rotaria sp. Silwood2]
MSKSLCAREETPLADYFCGRGSIHRECPSTHDCTIALNDAYGVCSPSNVQPPERNSNKPGLCPSSSGERAVCFARCNDDSECESEGEQKCCGGCRRQYVDPIFI